MPNSHPSSSLPNNRALQRQRQSATSSNAPSQTLTQTSTPPSPRTGVPAGTLRLRATGAPNEDRRIRWAEDVVDNEGLGRKKSKGKSIYLVVLHGILPSDYLSSGHAIFNCHWAAHEIMNLIQSILKILVLILSPVCCIYHAPSAIDESSSESDSSSSSGSDSESEGGGGDDGRARMGGDGKGKQRRKNQSHGHGSYEPCGGHGSGSKRKGKRKNAYERQPRPKDDQVETVKA